MSDKRKLPEGWEMEPLPEGWEMEAPARTPSGELLRPEERPTAEGAWEVAGRLAQPFAMGASFGALPKLAGLAGMGTEALAQLGASTVGATPEEAAELRYAMTGVQPGSGRSVYEAIRDQQKAELEKARAGMGKVATGLELAGGVVGGLATAPLLPAAAVPTQWPGLAARFGQYAKAAAAPAVIAATLGSEAEPFRNPAEVAQLARDVAIGTPIGIGAGALGGVAAEGVVRGVSAGASKLASLFGSNVQKAKLNAITPAAGIADALRKRKLDTPEAQANFVKEVDRLKLIGKADRTEDILKRVWQKMDEQGPLIEELVLKADANIESGAAPKSAAASRDWQKARTRDALDQYAVDPISARRTAKVYKQMEQDLPRDFETWQGKGPSYEELWRTKQGLESEAREMLQSSAAQERLEGRARQDVVDAYRQGFYEQLEQALGAKDFKALKNATKDYAILAKAEDLVSEKYSREQSHKMFGITDLLKGALVGGGFGAIGGPAVGIATAAGSALAKPRMGALWVTGLQTGQQQAGALAQRAASLVPEIEPLAIQTLSEPTAARAAKANGYAMLRRYFGFEPDSPEDASNEAYLKSQTDRRFQPGRR